MKKVTGDLAESHYETIDLSTGEVSARVPEFNRMSLKPGIGAEWIKRYNKDVYPRDVVIARGHESKPLGTMTNFYKVLMLISWKM